MRKNFDNGDAWHPFPRGGSPAPPREGARVFAVTVREPEAEADFAGDHSRRRYDRVAGPFDGHRVGLLDTPVRIYDLSLGGCFVNSTHEQRERSRLVLKIELPEEGVITVNAETVYRRVASGFAVRFVDVDAETEARLIRTVEALKERQEGDS